MRRMALVLALLSIAPGCGGDSNGSGTGGSSGSGGSSSGGTGGSSGIGGSSGGGGTGGASGGVGGGSGFSVSGTINPSGEPGPLAVAWIVSSGTPDYTYAFGSATSEAATFSLTLNSDPPAEALNSFGVGVGFVVLFKPGTSVPTGKVDFTTLESSIVGISAQYSVIFKAPNASTVDWIGQFPSGYACGKCVPASSGQTFDSFATTDCSTLEIVAYTTASTCNWT